jgi:uncharacterized protein
MNLLLDISRLRGEVHIERTFEGPALDVPADDFRVIAPVVVQADLSRDGTKARLVGQVTSTLELSCGRCLDPFPVPVDARFDLMFLPAENADSAPAEGEIADDDVAVSFYRNEQIDLAEVIREQFYLVVPMKPLCRPDCLGLCPVCGNNRNVDPCTCQSAWVDPRLEPLRKLTGDS